MHIDIPVNTPRTYLIWAVVFMVIALFTRYTFPMVSLIFSTLAGMQIGAALFSNIIYSALRELHALMQQCHALEQTVMQMKDLSVTKEDTPESN